MCGTLKRTFTDFQTDRTATLKAFHLVQINNDNNNNNNMTWL